MKDPLIMEVRGYFGDELSRLERELVAKEEEYRKALEVLRRLPLASRLERLLKPLLKWLLPRKVKKLRTEIANLREKIKQYKQAETGLKEGKYELALILLDELADRFFFPATPSSAGLDSWVSAPNSMFYHIIDLREELEVRMKTEPFRTGYQHAGHPYS